MTDILADYQAQQKENQAAASAAALAARPTVNNPYYSISGGDLAWANPDLGAFVGSDKGLGYAVGYQPQATFENINDYLSGGARVAPSNEELAKYADSVAKYYNVTGVDPTKRDVAYSNVGRLYDELQNQARQYGYDWTSKAGNYNAYDAAVKLADRGVTSVSDLAYGPDGVTLINKATGQPVRTREADQFDWSPRGAGRVDYDIVKDASGNPIIKPKWKTSTTNLGILGKLAPLAAGLVPGVGAILAPITAGLTTAIQGGDIGDVLKGAGLGYLGGQLAGTVSGAAGSYLPSTGISAIDSALAKAAGSAVSGGARAAITGGDPLTAALTGAVTGGLGGLSRGLISGLSDTDASTALNDENLIAFGDEQPTTQGTTMDDYSTLYSDEPVASSDWFTQEEATANPAIDSDTYWSSETGQPTLGDEQPTGNYGALISSLPSALQTGAKSIFDLILANPRLASAGLGALLAGLDRQKDVKPYGGGTTRARQSLPPLTRTITQGKYGPIARYAQGGISELSHGRFLRGPGDGVSDSIPATIEGKQPARLADGEFVIPARIVSELGNGSSEAGARKLKAMMARIQSDRRKAKDIAANTKVDRHLPA